MSMTLVTRSWFSRAGLRDRERERDLSSSLVLRDLRRLSAERLRLRDLSSSEAIILSLYNRARCSCLACLGPEAGSAVYVPGDVKRAALSRCATWRLRKCKGDVCSVALSLVLAYCLQ